MIPSNNMRKEDKTNIILAAFVFIIYLLINFIIGSGIIQNKFIHPEEGGGFTCSFHYSPICEKEYGFDTMTILYSWPILNFIIGFLIKARLKKSFLYALLFNIFAITIIQLIVSVFKIPILYTWERSSLHYDFIPLASVKYVVEMIFVLLGVVFYFTGKIIRFFYSKFRLPA